MTLEKSIAEQLQQALKERPDRIVVAEKIYADQFDQLTPEDQRKFFVMTGVYVAKQTVITEQAIKLLTLINAEWTSDPQSVACFDRRIVLGTWELLQTYKDLLA